MPDSAEAGRLADRLTAEASFRLGAATEQNLRRLAALGALRDYVALWLSPVWNQGEPGRSVTLRRDQRGILADTAESAREQIMAAAQAWHAEHPGIMGDSEVVVLREEGRWTGDPDAIRRLAGLD